MLREILPCLVVLLGSIHFSELSIVDSGHEFDILIFSQIWPATSCKEWKKNNPQHSCTLPKENDIWTIHGIWPTKLGTRGPSFCNRTWLFDQDKIRPIESELMEVWTNVHKGTPVYALWSHEWTKHGTCAAQLEPFNSELKYFSMGLDMIKKFTMTNVLEASNIVPSNTQTYTINEINTAVKNKIGFDSSIVCIKDDGKNYLSEIRICFTKDLKNTDCDGIVGRKIIGGDSIITNCDSTEDITYLDYNNNLLYVQLYRLVTWLQWFTL